MSGLDRVVEADPTATRRRYDAEQQVLVAGRCERCGATSWPRRAACYRCGGSDVVEYAIGGDGTLVTWTRVWVASGEVEPPYVLGMIDIGGLRLFSHVRRVTDDLVTPALVRLVVDGHDIPPFWFEVFDADRAGATARG